MTEIGWSFVLIGLGGMIATAGAVWGAREIIDRRRSRRFPLAQRSRQDIDAGWNR